MFAFYLPVDVRSYSHTCLFSFDMGSINNNYYKRLIIFYRHSAKNEKKLLPSTLWWYILTCGVMSRKNQNYNYRIYIYIYIYIYIWYIYVGHKISFQTFFVWALLLILHTWNSSPLRSNDLRLQFTCCTVPKTSGRSHGSPIVWPCQWPSSQPLSSVQLSHNESLWASGITKSHREQARTIGRVRNCLGTHFIAYRSSNLSNCIFEIHQLWQSGFSSVYSNCCCSYSFEPEIIRIGQSSQKMFSNKILRQFSMPIRTKSGYLSYAPRIYIYIYIYIYIIALFGGWLVDWLV